MSTRNSYVESMTKLTRAINQVLGLAEGMNEAMESSNENIQVTETLSLPSYQNVLDRLRVVEDTVAKFTQGQGIVKTQDGTYRSISVSAVPKAPTDISFDSTYAVSQFGIDPNWFFESLQFPRCVIRLNLKDLVPDDSDRILIDRVILDSKETTLAGNVDLITFWETNINNKSISYNDLIKLLVENGISYREDKQEVTFPLTYEKNIGDFNIISVYLADQDNSGYSKTWYELDDLYYSEVDESGVEITTGKTLVVGDTLRFGDTLYRIAAIYKNSVRLENFVGYEIPGEGDTLSYYSEPFARKDVNIGIGINEIDIVYVKGVDEAYNITSRGWSTPISFYTNRLVFEEDKAISFPAYYSTMVSDFGATWIAQAKDKQIYAYDGLKPYAPVLVEDNFSVNAINTQLDPRLDKDTYDNLTSEIYSVKTQISSLRTAISANKDALRLASSTNERNNYQNLIDTDTNSLSTYTTQYQSLVEDLNTLLNESGVYSYSPKYHIRGFFSIPASRYIDESTQVGEQQVIGFEIRYRYIHTDNTGVTLNTYEYADNNEGIQTGVFSDWNIVESVVRSRVWDAGAAEFKWKSENTAAGTEININQIDIPIRSGEKVEFKVRSISEAGWPYNPLKSEWSNSIIISFPDNLVSEKDKTTTILENAKNDLTSVVLQQTLTAAGVYAHLNEEDSVFRHRSESVSFTQRKNEGDNVVVSDVPVQSIIESILSRLNKIEEKLG